MEDSTRTTAVGEPDRPLQVRPGAQELAGTSFKHEHLSAILADGLNDGFFEVHAENYMGAGGPPHRALYTKETLEKVCDHVNQVQEAIKRPILLENPSTYVAFASSTMSETDFLRAVAQHTGCGLLLDVNNVFVSANNHGFSASAYLAGFPLEEVGEIHLAGYSEQEDDENELLLIDSHDRAISDSVWTLYRDVVSRIGPRPTLIEWDSNLPDWPVLRAQALTARRIMAQHGISLAGELSHEV